MGSCRPDGRQLWLSSGWMGPATQVHHIRYRPTVERTVHSVPDVRGSPHGGPSARLTRQPGEGPELRPVRSITWITGIPVNLLVLATMSRPMTFDTPSGLVDRMMASNFSRRTTS